VPRHQRHRHQQHEDRKYHLVHGCKDTKLLIILCKQSELNESRQLIFEKYFITLHP
jgi:hypothetical protein